MDILISGASTGIGRAVSIHLARLGHTTWSGVRTQKAFDELTRLNIQGLKPIFLDVADSDSIKSAVAEVKKKSGMINALVNNAGIAVGGPIESLSLADWRRQFDTNFFGTVELTTACLSLLREAKGRIVNISSISGRVAGPYLSPYAASKFALEAFSDSLRRELGHLGVKVCVVEPGPIKTPIWEKSRKEALNASLKVTGEIRDVYGTSVDKFMKSIESAERSASPVSVVVKAVVHALTANPPRTRYPVGRGIGVIAGVSRILPDKWMDHLVRRM